MQKHHTSMDSKNDNNPTTINHLPYTVIFSKTSKWTWSYSQVNNNKIPIWKETRKSPAIETVADEHRCTSMDVNPIIPTVYAFCEIC